MPNFVGCRCCQTDLVAVGDTNGDVRLLKAKTSIISGSQKFYYATGKTTLVNVAVFNRSQVVMIDQTKRYIVDGTGLVSTTTDTTGGGRNDHAHGLKVANSKIYAVANPPYRCDFSGTVEQTYSLTFGTAQDMTFVNDIAVDSAGHLYIIGQDVGNVSNPPQYALRKFDTDGSNLWDIVKGDYSAQTANCIAIDIDENDNIYTIVRYLLSGTNYQYLEKRNSSGTVQWSVNLSFVDTKTRYMRYRNGSLYVRVVRSGTTKMEVYSASTGSLTDTWTTGTTLLSNSTEFVMAIDAADPIIGKTDADVVRQDFANNVLKWANSDSGGSYIASLDIRSV